MGANMCCPPAVEPPTPEHAKCRKLLRILAIALVPVCILGAAAGDRFQIFISLFLIFFLFIGWRTLNWCSVLFFLIYSLQQIIQSSIAIAG